MENILKKYQWIEKARKQIDSLDSEKVKERILRVYFMGDIVNNAPIEGAEEKIIPPESIEMKQFRMMEELYYNAKRSADWHGSIVWLVL